MKKSIGIDTFSDTNRRTFLKGVVAVTVMGAGYGATAGPPSADIPIIDSHIHLFDASRPLGAPYKGPKEFTSHISLPGPYSSLAAPLGIVYDTDAKVEPKVRIVGLFPDSSHPPIIYPGAVTANAVNPEAASFLAFLQGPQGAAVFRKYGFVVLPRPAP